MTRKKSHRASYLTVAIFAGALILLIAAIWWMQLREQTTTLDLAGVAPKPIEIGSEWREGWRINRPTVIHCGAIPENAALRLGFFHTGGPEGWFQPRASYEVRGGDRLIARGRIEAKSSWHDYCVDFPRGAEGECTVHLKPTNTFLLSHCEVYSKKTSAPAVFIFLIDALRLDHMGCYGYERETTPNIAAFAEDAIKFTQLMPPSSWTRPSVASLFTSLYPEMHGAQDRADILRSKLPSLAASLQAAGFETLGFMSNPNCLPEWGFGDGFRRYVNVNSYNYREALDEEVIDHVLESLPCHKGRPCFTYIHTMAPHGPYTPPAPYDTMFGDPASLPPPENDICLYDGEIAYIDAQFARFLDRLKREGLYEKALILLLSDHGEGLMTHGKPGHGNTLYEELLRVPLFIKLPGNAHGGETRTGLVEIIDIAPTIMELLGLPPNPDFAGVSFASMVEADGPGKPVGYASLRLDKCDWRTAKTRKLKFLHNLKDGWKHWYDLVRDPGERQPMRTAGENGLALAQHAAEMESRGAAGLHLLFVPSPKSNVSVTGSIKGDRVAMLPTASVPTQFQFNEETQSFSFELLARRARGWKKRACASVRAEVEPEASPQIEILVDGNSVAPENVFVGEKGAHLPLDGSPIDLACLAAQPNLHDVATLPEKFAVYLWYVPEPERIADEDLSPEMVEALRGLGYLE
ncbi:MAG: sulfatase [Candidatus Hydrogenedentota bacterium]